MIAKPNKDLTKPQNYRPISLLSHIGKLFERIVNTILTQKATNLNLIPDHQFGFRSQYDTQMQLLRITDAITVAFNEKQYVIATFLDVQGAFDKVWHDGLISKLYTANIPAQLIILIQNFIKNRTFQVKEGKSLSNKEAIKAGVPQGSPLSPLLYNLYTADFIPHAGVQLATYADDTMMFTNQHSLRIAIRQMTKALQGLHDWTIKWKTTVNTQKSSVIIFARRRLPQLPRFQFGLQPLDFTNTVKYLGVFLDRKLTFEHHIQHIKTKCHKIIGLLYPIFLAHNLSMKNKLILFKSLVRSSMTYAGPVFQHAAKSHLRHLQVLQNRCLRLITGHEKSTRIQQLHEDTDLPTITEFLQELQHKIWQKLRRFHHNPLIRNIGAVQPRRVIYRLPRP